LLSPILGNPSHPDKIRLADEQEAAGYVVSEIERLSLPADVKCADTT
jgi:hypothetical protein